MQGVVCMWRFLFNTPSFYLISSGTLMGCHPSGTSTLTRSISSFCCLCCISLILFPSPCFLLLFVSPHLLFLTFCPFLSEFFLGHNKLVWWVLFFPVVGLLELPKYSMGHPLISFPKGSTAGPSLPKSQHWPPGHKPQDALKATEAVKIFHVKVWKEYSDRESFSHSLRNGHWFNTFMPRCGAGKGSGIFSTLLLSGQSGHQPVPWNWRQFCCFPLHLHEGFVLWDVLETSMVSATLKASHGMCLLICTEENDTQVCVKYSI